MTHNLSLSSLGIFSSKLYPRCSRAIILPNRNTASKQFEFNHIRFLKNLDPGVMDRVIFSGFSGSLAALIPPREKVPLLWPGRLTERQSLGSKANYVKFRKRDHRKVALDPSAPPVDIPDTPCIPCSRVLQTNRSLSRQRPRGSGDRADPRCPDFYVEQC